MQGHGTTLGRLVLSVFTGLVLVFLIVPTLIIFPLSFSNRAYFVFPPPGWSTMWYAKLFADENYARAFLNSLKVGVPTVALATVLGTCAALAVTRGSLPMRRAAQMLIVAPLMLPEIVYATGAYPVMAKLRLAGTYLAVILSHTVIAIPVVFITVSASLKSYRPTIEIAARTLGANAWQAFRYVTLPMIRGGVIAGAVLAFTLSFDDLILSLFLASPITRTLPLLLWESLRYELTPLVTAATSLILLCSLLFLGISASVQGAKREKAS
jgi:ABC-type spermidine/putrescine transport system permease subunit II